MTSKNLWTEATDLINFRHVNEQNVYIFIGIRMVLFFSDFFPEIDLYNSVTLRRGTIAVFHLRPI